MLNNNSTFILTPITEILKDVVSASTGVGNGIETYPICDYVMQSVFLKMTGAQEQKIKIISWELASNNYEYRYYRFTQQKLGECSNYKDKQEVYKDLLKQIKNNTSSLNLDFLDRNSILSDVSSSIENIFSGTNLLVWAQKSFDEYLVIWNNVKNNHFANDLNNLFTGIQEYSLKDIYVNHLYKQRNKTAHNTHSYQQNLPTLKTLIDENYKYENYFVYFAILVLIDKIFIELYKKYIETIEIEII